MAKCFGTWFRDYSGPDEVLQMLQIHWEADLANDYLTAGDYKTPEDVAIRLKQGFSDPDYIQTHIYRAWLEYQQELGKPSYLEWPRKSSAKPVRYMPKRAS